MKCPSRQVIKLYYEILITMSFIALIFAIIFIKQDPNDHDVLNILTGILGTAFVKVINAIFDNTSKDDG